VSALGPGWVDAFALAIKTGDEEKRAESIGVPVRKRFRVNYDKIRESASRGGLKGGAAKKGKKHAKFGV
jgi:hypothetical protein